MQRKANAGVFLTIFTPTFNRADLLKRLHESLVAQNHDGFERLIVDDGSTDGTTDLVKQWQNDPPFPIRYVRQDNSGKHVAHNLGAQMAHGTYFMCVDSDDWLEPFAVSTIARDVQGLTAEQSLIYPRYFTTQKKEDIVWFPSGVKVVELADIRMKYGLSIETAIVFNTQVLSKHPFPMIEGEHFISEGSAYYDFTYPEVFVAHPDAFYRCEYQDEGLTKNVWKNWLRNPTGTKMTLGKRYTRAKTYKGKNAFKERLSALLGIESLNMALGLLPFDGLPTRSVMAVVALPLAAYLTRNRYGK